MSAEHGGGSSHGDVDTCSERSWYCGTPDNRSPVAPFLHETSQEHLSTDAEPSESRPKGLTGLEFRETVDSTEAVLSLLLEGWPTGTGGVVSLPSGLWTTVGRLVRELIRRVNFLEEQLEKSQLEWQAVYQDKILAQKQLQMHISKSTEAMKQAGSHKAALQEEVERLRAALEAAQAMSDVQQARLEATETALHSLQLQQLRPSQRKKSQAQQPSPSDHAMNVKLQKSLQHEREVNKKLQQQRKGLVSAHKRGHSMEQLSVQLKVQKEETHTVLMLNNALETEVRQLKMQLAKVQTSSTSSLSTSSITTQDTSNKDQTSKGVRLTKLSSKQPASGKVNTTVMKDSSSTATSATTGTKASGRPSATTIISSASGAPNSSGGSGQAQPATPSSQRPRLRAGTQSTHAKSPNASAVKGTKVGASRRVQQERGKQISNPGKGADALENVTVREAAMQSTGSSDSAAMQPTTPNPLGQQDPAPASSEATNSELTNSSLSSTLLDLSSSQDHTGSVASAGTGSSLSPRVVRTPKSGTPKVATPKAATPKASTPTSSTPTAAARRTTTRPVRSPVVHNPRSTQLSQGQKPSKPQAPKWIP